MNINLTLNNEQPECTTPSKREKGHYGVPHLTLIIDSRFGHECVFKILVPYFEMCEEGPWLSWVDHYGNLYTPIDDAKPQQWMVFDKVDPKQIEALGLAVPSDEDWIKVLV